MRVSAETGGRSGEWRTFGERVIFESPEVWLGQVDMGLPSRERVWRPVVRVGKVVSVAALDEGGRVLLM
jgi:hypothetical protein